MKIIDCMEPLVDLKKACPKLVIQIDDGKTAYLRKTVAEKLCEAIKFLPKGMTFSIRDAWRSAKTQKEIRESFTRKLKKKYPKLSNTKIIELLNNYVRPVGGKYPSGHLTGGAVDLRLGKNNCLVPMKSAKLSFEENAKLIQPKLPAYIQKNRQLMANALEKVGFQKCVYEYWHWSFGDWRWAKYQKKTAIYDVIEEIK